MADDSSPIEFEEIPLEDARRMGRGPRMEPMLYGTRFMLRLDGPTRDKLDELSTHFDQSAADIIRQLIAQAEPKDFPPSWQMKAAERRRE